MDPNYSFLTRYPAIRATINEFNGVISSINCYKGKEHSFIRIVNIHGFSELQVCEGEEYDEQKCKCTMFSRYWKPETMRAANIAIWLFSFLDVNKGKIASLDLKQILMLTKNLHSLRKYNKALDDLLDTILINPRKLIIDEANKKADEITQLAKKQAEEVTKQELDLINVRIQALKNEAEQLNMNAHMEAKAIVKRAQHEAKKLKGKSDEAQKTLTLLQMEIGRFYDTLLISKNNDIISIDKKFLIKIPYFKSLYENQWSANAKPTPEQEREFPNAKYKFVISNHTTECLNTFKKYLLFSIEKLDKVNNALILELYDLSDFLSFNEMMEDLMPLLEKKEFFDNPDNLFSIFSQYAHGPIFDTSINHMVTRIDDIVQNSEYLKLSHEVMISLLKHEDIWNDIEDECEIFLIVGKWVEHQQKEKPGLPTFWHLKGKDNKSLFDLIKKDQFSTNQIKILSSKNIISDAEAWQLMCKIQDHGSSKNIVSNRESRRNGTVKALNGNASKKMSQKLT
jgi:vacuolar-type H+-ATPase subunit H